MRKKKVDCYRQVLHEAVSKMKLDDKNPRIIIGGDMNNYDLGPALEEFLDF